MMSENRTVGGSVKILACRNCKSILPLFEFETEADTDSMGLFSAAQCNGLVIVIAEATLEEWSTIQSGELSILPPRLACPAELKGFHILSIKRIERGYAPPSGISFLEFKKLYRAPVVVYACPCCAVGDALETQELTVNEFESRGGRIIALGSLVVSS